MAISEEEYRRALRQTQSGYYVPMHGSLLFDPSLGRQTKERYDAAQSIVDQYLAQQREGGIGGPGEQDDLAAKAEEEWEEMRDLTIGERQRILDDPYLARSLGHYENMLEQGGPLTDELIGRMQAQAEQESAARGVYEKAGLRRQMARQNLRPGDPGYQASMRDVFLEDLRRRQGSRNELAIRQALENSAAQGQVAGQLSGARMRQLALAGQFGLAGANFLAQRSHEDPNNPAVARANYPSYGGYQPQQYPQLPMPNAQQTVTNNRTGTNRSSTQNTQLNPGEGSAVTVSDPSLNYNYTNSPSPAQIQQQDTYTPPTYDPLPYETPLAGGAPYADTYQETQYDPLPWDTPLGGQAPYA